MSCPRATGSDQTAATSPSWWWPRAAYVHLPFCAHHCGYCDFAVAVGRDDRRLVYLNALGRELQRLGEPQPVDTLFFGGGTPTYLTAKELDLCLTDVLHWLPLRPGHELSVEANPGTLDGDKIRVLVDHGLTRVSLGCQSFHRGLLRVLERDHEPDDVFRALELLRRHNLVISLDLIFGVPGQDAAMWRGDIDQALAVQPDGIATYGLTYEKGTRLFKQRLQGEVVPLEETVELSLYELAMDQLGAAGFSHYELSNFARPGKECRHNQVYWANDAYFGFGMGAAAYVHGTRTLNSRSMDVYVRRLDEGKTPVIQSETLAPRDRALETIGQQLRRDMGIDRRRYQEQTGFTLDDLATPTIGRLVELGLLHDDTHGVRLSRAGKCVADSVITEFWKSAH